jgi:hypothetical protein
VTQLAQNPRRQGAFILLALVALIASVAASPHNRASSARSEDSLSRIASIKAVMGQHGTSDASHQSIGSAVTHSSELPLLEKESVRPAVTRSSATRQTTLMDRLGGLPARRQLLLRDAVHRGGIPSNYLVLYKLAAARYRLGPDGWAWLAGIGYEESLNGRTMAQGVRNDPKTWWMDTNRVNGHSFCCVGPMQFNIYSSASAYGKHIRRPEAKSTWATFGVDANGDGVKNPYDARDAIFSAARKLAADGRQANGSIDWQRAILDYNNWETYYQGVRWAHDRYIAVARADKSAVAASLDGFLSGKTRIQVVGLRIPESDRGL